MNLLNRFKFFIAKRIQPIQKIRWDIISIWKGYRKLKTAKKHGEPIDMNHKQHIHIYPTRSFLCNLDCYFCQNKFYTKEYPIVPEYPAVDWLNLMNRMYNIHHVDIQGGEPMLYLEIVQLLNGLDNWNVVMFTNNPKSQVHKWNFIEKNNNNFLILVSYHPLEEKRDIREFIEDFKKIPKKLNPIPHMIHVPEVSYHDVRAAFAKRGIYLREGDPVLPTKYNEIGNDFKTVMCDSDMECIAPDLKIYNCTGQMFRLIDGLDSKDFDFKTKYKECKYYGLCGPCTMQRDVK